MNENILEKYKKLTSNTEKSSVKQNSNKGKLPMFAK
jgi:hypothetical protein